MARKPRADALVERLAANQKEALARWICDENLSYADAQNRLFQDFGLRVSQSAISSFYKRVHQERFLDQIAESATKANQVLAKFEANPADMYGALMNLVGKIALDKAMQDKLDVDTLFDLTRLAIANRKEEIRAGALEIEREKLELLKKRAEQAESAETVLREELTPEERQRRLKQIFGIAA